MAKKDKNDKSADEGKGKGGLKAKLKPVAMIAVAAAGYKFFLAPKPAEPPAEGEGVAAAHEDAEPEEGIVVVLPELVLNLAGPGEHYLRVGAAVVLEEGVTEELFKEKQALVSDVLVDVLSSKTIEQLRQPNSKAELKTELSRKVRAAFADEQVVRVVFTTFVMQ